MIIYEPENKKYVLDAVNRDDSCRMYTEGGSPYFETYAALEDSYGRELLQSFLFSCNYENVISPIEDKIVYVSPPAYYIVSNSVPTYGYHYIHPIIAVEYEKLDILQPLIDYMKADVKAYEEVRLTKCFLICDWKRFYAYNMRSVVNRSYAADERSLYGYDFVRKPDVDGQEKQFYE